jgi:cyanate lyase
LDRNNPFNFNKREMADSSVIGVRYEAFHAIYALWLKRKAEGMTQKDIADKLERDPAWVSRALGGPKNWTMRTLGELAEALGGHVEVKITAIEDLQAEAHPLMPPAQ